MLKTKQQKTTKKPRVFTWSLKYPPTGYLLIAKSSYLTVEK